MRHTKAPTLQDVAREAGVTAMTVSVVLNEAQSSTRVSAATRARVLAAAQRLQYRRNAVAVGLSRKRMETLGVVAVVDGGEINLYFLEVFNGILEGAAAHGQNTTVFSVSDWQKDEERLLSFCDGRVDGLILIAPSLTPALVQRMPEHTPFVTLHCDLSLPESCNLEVDNEAGACLMTSHLIAQGHRRILFLGGDETQMGPQRRRMGYRRALALAGIPLDDSLIVPGSFSVHSGRVRMERWLAEHGKDALPTAVFCASDAIAAGCMETLAQHGLRAPHDISVAGFDDTLMARATLPPLTTVRQPFRDMGRHAVERLLLRIRRLDAPLQRETALFPVELIVRESVAPPAAPRLSAAS